MLAQACLSLLALSQTVLAHGGHESSGPAAGETIQQYAQRHMSSEHHIDAFDIRSFFQLHDLNRDGIWDKEEIEAIYGVHHVYSQKKSKDDIEHQKKADHIVSTVMKALDLNRDGKVTPEELERVGLDGLPNFDDMGAEGHHYDVESEFFLHHEEQFHSTPETQTDESYNHPEDIEHFGHHEEIELKEAEREAKYQGITVEEVLKAREGADKSNPESSDPQVPQNDGDKIPIVDPQVPDHPHAEQVQVIPPVSDPSKPKITRVPPPEKQEPEVKFKNAKTEGGKKGEWGTGEGGYKPPKDAGDRMRKNMPYKYKFKRNWGDF